MVKLHSTEKVRLFTALRYTENLNSLWTLFSFHSKNLCSTHLLTLAKNTHTHTGNEEWDEGYVKMRGALLFFFKFRPGSL